MTQDSGAWLVVRSRSPTSESRESTALPVPRQACLGLARAVLAGYDDPARWLALSGGDDAVRTWLSRVSGVGGPRDATVAERPALRASPSLLERLAEDLVVGSAPGDTGPAAPLPAAGAEALVLAEAVTRMRSHARLADDFGSALQVARLESARELAYGAGHEINNPLANIATRAQSLLLEERDPERRRRLATIADQAFRARDMIGGLMLFARPPRPVFEDVQAADLLAAVADSVRAAALARGIDIDVVPGAEPIGLSVDRGQVEESLRAAVTNAVEAGSAGGRVVLAARISSDGADWCEITIRDDGPGMDESTVRRAFDPFFSGREAGRGAGLGLSKAWRFVEANGGRVVIESRSGEGTTVSVVLPVKSAVKDCPVSPS